MTHHDDTFKEFEQRLKNIINTWSNPDDRQVLFEQLAPLMFDTITAYQNLLVERVKKICESPPCLDMLIEGKTIEESQQYIEGAEEMRKKMESDIIVMIKGM